MSIFTVKTRAADETCFVKINGTTLRIELSAPADFQHAWRVANFLIENVTAIVPDAAEEAPRGSPQQG